MSTIKELKNKNIENQNIFNNDNLINLRLPIVMIVATDTDNGIGVTDGTKMVMPWEKFHKHYTMEYLEYIKKDMNIFKNVTKNNIVIMGFETFKSIRRKPLLNRINIVFTRKNSDELKHNYTIKDNYGENTKLIFFNPEVDGSLFDLLNKYSDENIYPKQTGIYVIGGKTIYDLFIDYTNILIKTTIPKPNILYYKAEIEFVDTDIIRNNFEVVSENILNDDTLYSCGMNYNLVKSNYYSILNQVFIRKTYDFKHNLNLGLNLDKKITKCYTHIKKIIGKCL